MSGFPIGGADQAPGQPPRDLGDDVDLAVWGDRLVQGVLVDLAVDGDGHAFLEMAGQRRVAFGQQLEQMLHGRRRQIELGDAARELYEIADQYHPGHDLPISAWADPRSNPCRSSWAC